LWKKFSGGSEVKKRIYLFFLLLILLIFSKVIVPSNYKKYHTYEVDKLMISEFRSYLKPKHTDVIDTTMENTDEALIVSILFQGECQEQNALSIMRTTEQYIILDPSHYKKYKYVYVIITDQFRTIYRFNGEKLSNSIKYLSGDKIIIKDNKEIILPLWIEQRS